MSLWIAVASQLANHIKTTKHTIENENNSHVHSSASFFLFHFEYFFWNDDAPAAETQAVDYRYFTTVFFKTCLGSLSSDTQEHAKTEKETEAEEIVNGIKISHWSCFQLAS